MDIFFNYALQNTCKTISNEEGVILHVHSRCLKVTTDKQLVAFPAMLDHLSLFVWHCNPKISGMLSNMPNSGCDFSVANHSFCPTVL